MRKYRRMALRLYAMRTGAKASKFVHTMWERYQIKKYGVKRVAINRAKGTHKKRLWNERIAGALYGLKRGKVA